MILEADPKEGLRNIKTGIFRSFAMWPSFISLNSPGSATDLFQLDDKN